MNNVALTYQLPTFTGVINHNQSRATLLRDTESDVSEYTKLEIDAQVRSGDYFVTLATKLDFLGKNITQWQARAGLEDIVSDLIYLQDNYSIIKNQPLSQTKKTDA